MPGMKPLSRRTFIRGLGAAIPLPFLDAMAAPANASTAVAPTRMVVLSIPMGVHPWSFFPRTTGRDYKMPYTLSPLEELRDDILILNHLHNPAAGRQRGAHVRNIGTFLTSMECNVDAETRPQMRVGGPSFDQVLARRVGRQTRLPSLNLAAEVNSHHEAHCFYGNNISWQNETTPTERLDKPLTVFHRLFGVSHDEELKHRLTQNRSILDLAMDESRRLRNRLGHQDRRKLDEYFHSVRTIEQQINSYLSPPADQQPPELPEGVTIPPKVTPAEKPVRDRLMLELLALALETDSTRIVTFSFGTDPHPGIVGIGETYHHSASHHQHNEERVRSYNEITKYCVEHFAWLLKRLKGNREGERTMLDHSMVLFAGAMGDGNTHSHHHLPVILGGKGDGTIETGRFVECPNNSQMSNLYLGMMQRMDADVTHFADSTGPLAALTSDPLNMPKESVIGANGSHDKMVAELYYGDSPKINVIDPPTTRKKS